MANVLVRDLSTATSDQTSGTGAVDSMRRSDSEHVGRACLCVHRFSCRRGEECRLTFRKHRQLQALKRSPSRASAHVRTNAQLQRRGGGKIYVVFFALGLGNGRTEVPLLPDNIFPGSRARHSLCTSFSSAPSTG